MNNSGSSDGGYLRSNIRAASAWRRTREDVDLVLPGRLHPRSAGVHRLLRMTSFISGNQHQGKRDEDWTMHSARQHGDPGRGDHRQRDCRLDHAARCLTGNVGRPVHKEVADAERTRPIANGQYGPVDGVAVPLPASMARRSARRLRRGQRGCHRSGGQARRAESPPTSLDAVSGAHPAG